MKYNMSSICQAANILTRSMSRSLAFKTAWAMAKVRSVAKVAGVRFGHRQAALQHLTQYPAEIIRIHLLRENGNHFDKNAVAAEVVGRGAYKVGYLESGVTTTVNTYPHAIQNAGAKAADTLENILDPLKKKG